MSKKIFIIVLIAVATAGYAQRQSVSIRKITRLPSEILESSGLSVAGTNFIWSHEDSGGDNKLYGFDTLGQLKRTITINNALAIDWEDLAVDDDGNIYIADLGNNANQRNDLTIYRISDPENTTSNNLTAQIIQVSFADQTSFPPSAAEKNFDVEAIVWRNGSLYLFTKDRSSPFSGITKMYKLDDQPGTYLLLPEDSFYTGSDADNDRITSADYNRNSGELILLTHNRLISFTDYQSDHFFDGTITEYFFTTEPGQNEAIGFITSHQLFMTEEGTGGVTGWLYEIQLPEASAINTVTAGGPINLYPIPAKDQLQISSPLSPNTILQVTTSNGTILLKSTLGACRQLDISAFAPGIGFITLFDGSTRYTKRFIKN